MSRMYSFFLDGSCPHCGKQLDQMQSVLVGDEDDAMVDENGVLSEDGETDLILSNPEPDVRCAHCKGVLDVSPVEETG